MSELNARLIPVDDISIPEISLRNVNTSSEQFLNLVQSVYDFGVIQTITVIADPKNPDKFILEDGKHRLTASKIARDQAKEKRDKATLNRVSFIPAIIQPHSIDDIPFIQIQANLHKIETSPIEFAGQIRRIWASQKFYNLTKEQLFQKLAIKGKSISWFDQQLKLADLCPEAKELVEEGKIPISAASTLAKLPIEEQYLWLDRAQTDKVDEFINAVNLRVGELKAEKRGQKKEHDPLDDIKPRKKTDFRTKIIEITENLNNSPDDMNLKLFAQGVLWGCQMDEETKKVREYKENEEKNKREQILKLRREKLLAIQQAAKPQIEKEIKAELGLA